MPAAHLTLTDDDDLDQLLATLPDRVRQALVALPEREGLLDLLEVVLDLGRLPEARFPGRAVDLAAEPVSREELAAVVEKVGRFGADNRAGIERTLHRISAIRNRDGGVVGLTCRVGRAVYGTVDILRDVVESGRSLLLLGRPGVGKTTLLREAARVLADELAKRVVVVDTSNEIAGDGDVPHPGIGRARRMQVPQPDGQHAVMIEAVENHMPEVIVIDEISTGAEAFAARTIAERGVQLIATVHGNTLENLLQNPTLADLVGGVQVVTLSDEEARRRRSQKTVLERKAPPTFECVVEIRERDSLAVHHQVADAVDRHLRGVPLDTEERRRTADGQVEIRTPEPPEAPLPRRPALTLPERPGKPLLVFPYAVARDRLERAVRELDGKVQLVDDLTAADLMLTVKSHERRLPKKLRDAQVRGKPLVLLRSNTSQQIDTVLAAELAARRVSEGVPNPAELESAIDRVLNSGQAVELTPQPAPVRRRQHERIAAAGLESTSLGQEPFRRVVVQPSHRWR